ncbi:MAG: hypothetical protein HYZ74_06500 [Elusimicrobia bacterium]|nr:hypothetical protein [Elusimicrobiota bacterium]
MPAAVFGGLRSLLSSAEGGALLANQALLRPLGQVLQWDAPTPEQLRALGPLFQELQTASEGLDRAVELRRILPQAYAASAAKAIASIDARALDFVSAAAADPASAPSMPELAHYAIYGDAAREHAASVSQQIVAADTRERAAELAHRLQAQSRQPESVGAWQAAGAGSARQWATLGKPEPRAARPASPEVPQPFALVSRPWLFSVELERMKTGVREEGRLIDFIWAGYLGFPADVRRSLEEIVPESERGELLDSLSDEQKALHGAALAGKGKDIDRFIQSLSADQRDMVLRRVVRDQGHRQRVLELFKRVRDGGEIAADSRYAQRKMREYAAFTELTRVNGLTGERIVDVAGGAGDLARIIGTRYPGKEQLVLDVSRRAWDYARYINGVFGQSLGFRIVDLFKEKIPHGSWLAKHPCGGLYDEVVHQWVQDGKSPEIFIMSCCQGRAAGFKDIARYGLTEAERPFWVDLTKMSDYDTSFTGRGQGPERFRSEIGEIAMTALDLLRMRYITSKGYDARLFRVPDVTKGNMVVATKGRKVADTAGYEPRARTFPKLWAQVGALVPTLIGAKSSDPRRKAEYNRLSSDLERLEKILVRLSTLD